MLSSSDRGGIRIQYSRNPFGKKRDYDGSFINTPTAATYTAPSYEQPPVAAPAYGSGGAVAAAAYSSGDYSAPATAPGVDGTQQTNGQAAAYDATAQPGTSVSPILSCVFACCVSHTRMALTLLFDYTQRLRGCDVVCLEKM